MAATSSQILLNSLGHCLPSDYHMNRANNSDRLIIVISHTSYWDFLLLLLYRQCDPRIRDNMYVVMMPQLFKWWGWLLRPLGGIPATRAEESGGGFVSRTIGDYSGRPLRLIISPEGKMEKTPWRSGYYHLCRGLQSDIMVGGVDYERKTLYIGPVHSWSEVKDMTRDELESKLQDEMGQIVPLYKDKSYTPVTRNYRPELVSAIDPYFIILVVVAIVITIIIVFLILSGKRDKGEEKK